MNDTSHSRQSSKAEAGTRAGAGAGAGDSIFVAFVSVVAVFNASSGINNVSHCLDSLGLFSQRRSLGSNEESLQV